MAEPTPGPWTIAVKPVSHSLEVTGYAHQVMIPGNCLPLTVAHHTHRNWNHIHTERLCNGHVRYTGHGARQPDLTPHPDAFLIAAALDLLVALEVAHHALRHPTDEWKDEVENKALPIVRAALSRARGVTK